MVIFCCHILAASTASSTASYQYEGQIKGCLICPFPPTLPQSQHGLCGAYLSITVIQGNTAHSVNSRQLPRKVSHNCKATVDELGHEIKLSYTL